MVLPSGDFRTDVDGGYLICAVFPLVSIFSADVRLSATRPLAKHDLLCGTVALRSTNSTGLRQKMYAHGHDLITEGTPRHKRTGSSQKVAFIASFGGRLYT